MRKKLLSLLTVLCLVLGMLPATVLAAELTDDQKDALLAQGYTEEEIEAAVYIDEDTELTEDVEGLVIVVAPVKVTVKGAKLATGLLVAPGAEGAAVTLSESADVNAVIVMAKAEVTVEETAVAASVTVTAPETTVTVAGTVTTVNVAEAAESTVVTVAETAKVTTVEVAAPDVKVDVAGTVETVTVAETATGAELVVAETAAITEVTDATGELTVSGDGAENVTVTNTSSSDEEEEKEDEETEDEETEEAEETGDKDDSTEDSFDFTNNGPTVSTVDLGIKTANLEDHPGNSAIKKEHLYDTYSVVTTHNSADAANEYKVVITATGLQTHWNDDDTQSRELGWVGIAIPKQENTTYTYYMLKVSTGTVTQATPGTDDPGYDSFYFAFGTGDRHDGAGYTYQLAVFEGTPTTAPTSAADFDGAKYVLDLAFELTMAADQGRPNGDDVPDENAPGEVELTLEDEDDADETAPAEDEVAPAEDEITPPAEDEADLPVDEAVENV